MRVPWTRLMILLAAAVLSRPLYAQESAATKPVASVADLANIRWALSQMVSLSRRVSGLWSA